MSLLPLFLTLALQSEIRVELPAAATVRGTNIRLGEIAKVEGADADLARRIATFDLGYAPAPGYSRFLRREHIAAELKRSFPAIAVSVAGERGCQIEPLTEEITAATLEATARQALLELYGTIECELTLETQLLALRVPQGSQGTAVRPALRERLLEPGSRSVPLEILVDGELYQTVWTAWKVELWQEQAVLARAVRRGEPLSPALFELQKVKVGKRPVESPLALADASGAIARRDLAAGALLYPADVEFPRVLQRGDIVRLDIQRGAIRASTLVVAQQDGRVGERIRVLQPETGKELIALVRSSETVEIQMNR